ncbi:cob(I)yrinic acid a,c-diamide adenosyltransferase [Phosphitispora fastidiosa]|uniref:cob(I)yrinic acid a,c-diamide adenosyltransferase n=1 Tax=Phosphitispora fastidiosa TaxID=2837202 RepID=UPI001E55881C|nr:cob(I)yrinic acid a,c-diamide adenosyltransferase [Phosphitispora fastidiosa]MBU7005232.1 cob(I)alamin adenosyltransferase [Phosphitispora fastidiosa]
MKIEKEFGLVQVYTGNGKGKTTASLGLAARAVGHGFRVHMIQFTKGRCYAGELALAHRLAPQFSISQFGRGCRIGVLIKQGYKKCTGCGDCFLKDRGPDEDDFEHARLGYEEALEYLSEGRCDMLILDEIGNAIRYNLVTADQVVKLIKNKPANIELILTGRAIPEQITELADLVTEMTELKHPYKKGVGSRRGIEY